MQTRYITLDKETIENYHKLSRFDRITDLFPDKLLKEGENKILLGKVTFRDGFTAELYAEDFMVVPAFDASKHFAIAYAMFYNKNGVAMDCVHSISKPFCYSICNECEEIKGTYRMEDASHAIIIPVKK